MTLEEQMKADIGKEVSKHTAKKIGKIVGIVAAVVGGAFFVVFLGFLLGWVIQLLWNYTVVDMFDWPKISYWQAVATFILAKIFFGFGHFGGHAKHKGRRHHAKDKERAADLPHSQAGVPDAPSNMVDGTMADESFKRYWQAEGKAAYDAFVAANKGNPPNESER